MSFWENKKVLITGGAGFIASHAVETLVKYGAKVRVVDNLENGSLENLENVIKEIEFIQLDIRNLENCLKVTEDIEIVLNFAAKVGGIEYNRTHPGTMFYNNILINTNMLESARLNNIERFLVISTACVYPRFCKIPTPETEGFIGVPEPTNEGYGWAKRMAEFQAQAYEREFGMKIAIARPYNCYGPRDHFDTEKSHVIPALIKRIFDNENPVVVWGDGEQSRAFLYVSDFVRGCLMLIEKYPVADPVNIGTDEEIKIKDLVKLIIKLSGKNSEIYFDTTKPSGQPRRNCDNTKARTKIGFVAEIKLEEGLKKTIDWYLQKYGKNINNINL